MRQHHARCTIAAVCFMEALFLISAPFFSAYAAALHSLIITEIAAAAPTTKEWIEIYNTTNAPLSLDGWHFVEGLSTSKPQGVRHTLTGFRGDLVLDPYEYAVIAHTPQDFLQDYPNFAGTLIDSSWDSLKESGEQLLVLDANDTVVDDVFYPAIQEGVLAVHELTAISQRTWYVVQTSTPGAENIVLQAPALAEATPSTSATPVETTAPPSQSADVADESAESFIVYGEIVF